ncbi:MAG: tripartite tricarboxylate transporter substrate binding protein [Actinomycetota bacterium]|nr:tripartite tricarboxylate transporter substrate binding protein [Actinomycetota bacterium]
MHSHHRLGSVAVATIAILTLATGCSEAGGASGSFQPRGNVTMVVPFEAGGGSDASGRAIAAGLEKVGDGFSTSVENRVGGSGAVGYSDFLGRNGEENTLLASETAMLALPLTQDVEFDYTDFTPIMKLGDDYTLVVVPAESPYKTCSDVVAAARSGRVVAAVSGATSLDEIVFSLIEDDQGVEFDRVPFESGSEVISGMLGGDVDVASLNPGEVVGQIKSGDLKPLCAASDERYDTPDLADVPTAKEQGIDVSFAQFRGFIAPGGISPEAKKYWIEVAKKFAETPEYQKYIDDNLMQDGTLYGDDFTAYLEKNNADLEKALR